MSNLIKLDTSLPLENLPAKKDFLEQGRNYVLKTSENPIDTWIMLKRMNDLTDDARKALEEKVAEKVTELLKESENKTVTYRGHKITLSQNIAYRVIPNKTINGLIKRRKELETKLEELMPEIKILQDSIKSINELITEEEKKMIANNDPLTCKDETQPKPTLTLKY